jgi:hypothetical protein
MKITNTVKTIKLLAILFISALTFTACSEDDHDDHDHEEEVITTVNYTLTSGSDVVTLTYRDLDGEGGNEGVPTVFGSLSANTTYAGAIELLNETESPAENMTEEIEEEDDEHEFFFTSTVTGLTISKTDVDGDGNPLGLETSLASGAAGSGSITIVLKHEPTKPNDGTSASAGGSTELEVTFNVTVQ